MRHDLFQILFLLACFSGLFHTPPKDFQEVLSILWIETTSIFIFLSFLKRSSLNNTKQHKDSSKQNNDKSDFCVLCRKSDDEMNAELSACTHTRVCSSDHIFLPAQCFLLLQIFHLFVSVLGWNFMHLVFDLWRIDGFAFGTLLLSQA